MPELTPAVPEPTPRATPSTPPAAVPLPLPVVPAPGAVWPWVIGGAALLVLLGALGWAKSRRRLDAPAEVAVAAAPESPAVAPPPPPPPAPVAEVEPFAVSLGYARIQFAADAIAIDLELVLTNHQPQTAEGIRPALALVSASPDQDRWSAAFHAGPPPQSHAAPIDLVPGVSIRLPARLTLQHAQIHVVQLGGRPMFVAMLMLDLRWRAGLSIRRFGADFLLGSAGQGPRPGPIWLDRPPPAALAASRYRPSV